jgi:hypothetical protein
MTPVFVPSTATRPGKVKQFTKRQLTRLRVARERELREQRAEAARMRTAWERKAARGLTIFKGCDPERTLALIGEDA